MAQVFIEIKSPSQRPPSFSKLLVIHAVYSSCVDVLFMPSPRQRMGLKFDVISMTFYPGQPCWSNRLVSPKSDMFNSARVSYSSNRPQSQQPWLWLSNTADGFIFRIKPEDRFQTRFSLGNDIRTSSLLAGRIPRTLAMSSLNVHQIVVQSKCPQLGA